MKRTKAEEDFFKHFDDVEVQELKQEAWEKFVLSQKQIEERYK